MGLRDELVFYGQYHNNKWNQLIHFFFVPLILWSAHVLMSNLLVLPVPVADWLSFLPWSAFIVCNLPFIHWVGVSLHYIKLAGVVGLIASVFYFFLGYAVLPVCLFCGRGDQRHSRVCVVCITACPPVRFTCPRRLLGNRHCSFTFSHGTCKFTRGMVSLKGANLR